MAAGVSLNMTLKLLLPAAGALLAAPLFIANAAPPAPNGELLFKQRCSVCHSVNAGGPSALGPNLAGVSRRKAGSGKFAYTPSLKAAKISWTKETLETFLAGPTKMVPGTRMVISVTDPGQRAAIVAYLATLR
jgi:cytochrome c